MYSFYQIHSAFSVERKYIFMVKIRSYLGLTDKDIFKIVNEKHPELFLEQDNVFWNQKEISEDEYTSSDYDKYSMSDINVRIV